MHVYLPCFEKAQITRTYLKIVKALKICPKACVAHQFSSKVEGEEGLYLNILVFHTVTILLPSISVFILLPRLIVQTYS